MEDSMNSSMGSSFKNFATKLAFGKTNINSHMIEKISRIIQGQIEAVNLTKQEKQLLYLFQKEDIDLSRNEEESDIAIYILKKAVKQEIETNFLQKLIENISLFKEKPELLQKKKANKKILESLNLEFYKKNDVLFNMGDVGQVYYIVLKGSVNVLIKDPNQQNSTSEGSQQEIASKKQSQMKDKSTSNSSSQLSQHNLPNCEQEFSRHEIEEQVEDDLEDDIEDKDQKKESQGPNGMKLKKQKEPKAEKDVQKKRSLSLLLKGNFFGQQLVQDHQEFLKQNFPQLICVKTYTPGQSFGEIALLTNSKRTATCVAQSDTYLLTLSKYAFDEIMGAYSQQITEETLSFLRNFSFLRDLPTQKLLSLWHLFDEHNLKPRSILYTEKDPSQRLYFVRKGEIELSKYQKIIKEEEKEHEKLQKSRLQSESTNGLNCVRQNKERKNTFKRQPFVVLAANSYFGQEEILLKLKQRETQAMALTESQVYSIEKSKLVSILRFYHQLRLFVTDIKLRSEWHSERVENMIQTQKNQIKIENCMKRRASFAHSGTKSSQKNSSSKYQQQNYEGNFEGGDSSQAITFDQMERSQQQKQTTQFQISPFERRFSCSKESRISQFQQEQQKLPSYQLLQQYFKEGGIADIFNRSTSDREIQLQNAPNPYKIQIKEVETKNKFDFNNVNKYNSIPEIQVSEEDQYEEQQQQLQLEEMEESLLTSKQTDATKDKSSCSEQQSSDMEHSNLKKQLSHQEKENILLSSQQDSSSSPSSSSQQQRKSDPQEISKIQLNSFVKKKSKQQRQHTRQISKSGASSPSMFVLSNQKQPQLFSLEAEEQKILQLQREYKSQAVSQIRLQQQQCITNKNKNFNNRDYSSCQSQMQQELQQLRRIRMNTVAKINFQQLNTKKREILQESYPRVQSSEKNYLNFNCLQIAKCNTLNFSKQNPRNSQNIDNLDDLHPIDSSRSNHSQKLEPLSPIASVQQQNKSPNSQHNTAIMNSNINQKKQFIIKKGTSNGSHTTKNKNNNNNAFDKENLINNKFSLVGSNNNASKNAEVGENTQVLTNSRFVNINIFKGKSLSQRKLILKNTFSRNSMHVSQQDVNFAAPSHQLNTGANKYTKNNGAACNSNMFASSYAYFNRI